MADCSTAGAHGGTPSFSAFLSQGSPKTITLYLSSLFLELLVWLCISRNIFHYISITTLSTTVLSSILSDRVVSCL